MRFPTQHQFFNSLNHQECSTDDYRHAKHAWRTFECKTFRHFHDIYLKTDVTLLADFFQCFRSMCQSSYGLDPVHYFSAPGLAFDACLKMSKVRLDLFMEKSMHSLIESSICGGVSMISKRYAETNNRFMGDDYDPKKDPVHFLYVDANNLYGWAMSQFMPSGDFKWSIRNR